MNRRLLVKRAVQVAGAAAGAVALPAAALSAPVSEYLPEEDDFAGVVADNVRLRAENALLRHSNEHFRETVRFLEGGGQTGFFDREMERLRGEVDRLEERRSRMLADDRERLERITSLKDENGALRETLRAERKKLRTTRAKLREVKANVADRP